MEEVIQPIDGNTVVRKKDANKILKAHGNKVQNGQVNSFVSLQHINKVYPNGVQAVYDFNLEINQHDFIVLVGPSGCGKSTTLRMVAGLEDITSGYLYIDKVLSNYLPSKTRDISMVFQSYALYPQMSVYDNIAFPLRVRKYHRPKVAKKALGYDEAMKTLSNPELPQIICDAHDSQLSFGKPFEYLSTAFNISDEASKNILNLSIPHNAPEVASDYIKANLDDMVSGLRANLEATIQKASEMGYTLDESYVCHDKDGNIIYVDETLKEEEIRRKVFEAARILDLGPYLDRRPNELSGGQMQRVALGRAIVRNAKVFLMDEPLSNLDAKLRVVMRSEIVRLHEAIGATSIYVTHDQTEAMTMATKIVVMSRGWVQQIGTPQEIYTNPNNLFVATFIGSPSMNIFDATCEGNSVKFADGYTIKLDKSFEAKHKEFYERKVAETEYLINLINNEAEDAAIRIYDPLFDFMKGEMKASKLGGLSKKLVSKEHDRVINLLDTLEKEMLDIIDKKEMDGKFEYREKVVAAFKSLVKALKKESAKGEISDNTMDVLETLFTVLAEHIDAKVVSTYKGQIADELSKAKSNVAFDLELGDCPICYVKKQLSRIMDLFANHKKANKETLLNNLNELVAVIEDKEKLLAKAKEVRVMLHNYLTITEADMSKIYSAQSYINDEAKGNKVLSYSKKRKAAKKAKPKKAKKIDPRETRNNLIVMLEEYKAALKGSHNLKVGVRPEHIHLDSEYTNTNKTAKFIVNPNVVELLGGELLIHADYNNIDMIAKISSGTLLKAHENAELTMDGSKVLIFDKTSGERIY